MGDRERYLSEACRLLQGPDLTLIRQSALYETEPQELIHQPWFLNQVLEIDTRLFPRQLLARIHRVEGQLGRKRLVPNGPRTIDIDILLFGRFVVKMAGLTLPHPRMCERRFVLEPLAELAPDLRHPQSGKTIRDILAGISAQKVQRVGPRTEGWPSKLDL